MKIQDVVKPPKASSVKLPIPFVLVASAHLCPGTSSGTQPQELGWDFRGTVDLSGGERLDAVSVLPKWQSRLGSQNQYLRQESWLVTSQRVGGYLSDSIELANTNAKVILARADSLIKQILKFLSIASHLLSSNWTWHNMTTTLVAGSDALQPQ